ncbi:hypothetical protein GUJ93_ZPchr0004g40200 [Zizania palustris]|uniref:Uncharacterized protein n=1 Tax=Zizania palustris TaxID=103762 RepID=A0A8J5VZ18_ZIZPA|nr:hypothetical protein GUJ93_ZPchr0004g40200 [Zizania palustris]
MHATTADSSSIDRCSLLSSTVGRLRIDASHPTVNHCLSANTRCLPSHQSLPSRRRPPSRYCVPWHPITRRHSYAPRTPEAT